MPDPESREQLFQDYFELQQEAQSYATQVRTRDKHISYLLKSLKQVATPREADVHTNVAQVVLNTRAINRIIKEIQSNIDKKPSLTSIAQQQTLGAPFNFEESSKIIEEGEKLTEREDLNTQAANYLLTMTEAQVIGGELETLATETQNMKPSDRSVLTDVQNGTTTMEERVKSMLGRLADRAKMVGESFLKIINGIKNKAKTVTSNFRDFVVSSIKSIADKLREFITALIGAIFDLAAWIQEIAITRNFTTKDFTIEIQPLEISIVGGISIPKFQTPKLSVSFGPK